MKILITGLAGTGKSSIAERLLSMSLPAFDGDRVPNLARWEDAATRKPLELEDVTNIDSTKIHWNWNAAVLNDLLKRNQEIYFCGSADNEIDFLGLFDKIFVLSVNPAEHRNRLTTRTNNNYGKHPEKIKTIIHDQSVFRSELISMGAREINANRPINEIIDDILTKSSS